MFPGVAGNHSAVHDAVTEHAGMVSTVQDTTVVSHHHVASRPGVPVNVVGAGRVGEQELDHPRGLLR